MSFWSRSRTPSPGQRLPPSRNCFRQRKVHQVSRCWHHNQVKASRPIKKLPPFTASLPTPLLLCRKAGRLSSNKCPRFLPHRNREKRSRLFWKSILPIWLRWVLAYQKCWGQNKNNRRRGSFYQAPQVRTKTGQRTRFAARRSAREGVFGRIRAGGAGGCF